MGMQIVTVYSYTSDGVRDLESKGFRKRKASLVEGSNGVECVHELSRECEGKSDADEFVKTLMPTG